MNCIQIINTLPTIRHIHNPTVWDTRNSINYVNFKILGIINLVLLFLLLCPSMIVKLVDVSILINLINLRKELLSYVTFFCTYSLLAYIIILGIN